MVFQRGGSAKGTGHVAFATGKFTDTHIEVVGGNQSNSITQKSYKLRGGFFWRLRTVRRAVACDDGTTHAQHLQRYNGIVRANTDRNVKHGPDYITFSFISLC